MLLSALVMLAVLISSAEANVIRDHEQRLMNYLFNNSVYNKRSRPAPIDDTGRKLPLAVTVTFSIHNIIGLDEQMETTTILAYVWETWHDVNLAWNPHDYGGINQITVLAKEIWIPDIYLTNTFIINIDDKTSRSYALIRAVPDPANSTKWTAQVFLSYDAIMQERCPMHMHYFPFDRQNCQLCLCTTVSTNEQIVYHTNREVFDTSYSSEGGRWMLVEARGVNSTYIGWSNLNYSCACMNLTAQRRSLYYAVNLFVPTTTICLLNTVGLFARLDQAHGQLDIASLGQTTLLALGVIMLTVADQTPKGSAVVSLLSFFFITMIIQTLLATFISIYLRNSYNQRRKKAKARYQHLAPITTPASKEIHWETVCMIANIVFIGIVLIVLIGIGFTVSRY